jgi:hypothetical protein
VATIAARIGSELQEDGWTVGWSKTELNFKINFAHALAGEFGAVGMPDADASRLDNLARHMMSTDTIFQLVRERPANLEHPATMHTIRVTAAMADWNTDDIRHVCNILLKLGQLSDEEAAWVVRAGSWKN